MIITFGRTSAVAGLLLAGLLSTGAANAASTLDQPSMKLAAAAPTTLHQAVIAAEKASKGQAFDSAVIMKNGGLVYEVKLAADGKFYRYDYNLKTGKVIGSAELKDADINALKGLSSVKLKIEDAMKSAEKSGKGRAIDATYVAEAKSGTYVIEVLEEKGKIQTFTIDAASGNILKTA